MPAIQLEFCCFPILEADFLTIKVFYFIIQIWCFYSFSGLFRRWFDKYISINQAAGHTRHIACLLVGYFFFNSLMNVFSFPTWPLPPSSQV